MNLNRDEFLLLAHTGRGPHRTRPGPGPGPAERFEAEAIGRRFRRRGRGRLTLRRGTGAGLRHVLAPRDGGTAPGGIPRRTGDLDEQTYFELEFAVGFPAEEETLM